MKVAGTFSFNIVDASTLKGVVSDNGRELAHDVIKELKRRLTNTLLELGLGNLSMLVNFDFDISLWQCDHVEG